MQNIFFDIGLIIIIATIFAYAAKLIRQPLIPAYVLTGFIIGPLFGWITNKDIIFILSEIGIAFLLFIVGLEIDLRKLKNVGIVSSLGGTIRIVLLFAVGFIAALILGFIKIEAIYVGVIIAFSLTMVVVKLLSDRRELDTLHGRDILGFLLIEDLFAIFVLSILTTFNNLSAFIFIISIIKGIFVVLVAYTASKYIFPPLFKFAAKSQELLFLLAVAVLFSFSLLFNQVGNIMIGIWNFIINLLPYLPQLSTKMQSMIEPGFSIIIGSFVAGVSLANLPYNIEIISKVNSLKDFFATIFFVSLGMQLVIGSIGIIIEPLIFFTLFILIFKPILTMFVCSFFGYKRRTGFLAAISLAQISEFSLIIAAQGLLLGHIGEKIFSLTVILAIITIVFTSYFIKYDDSLYRGVSNYISVFDRFTVGSGELEYTPKKKKDHVILCGYNRIGYSVARTLKRLNRNILVVDFNPEVINMLIKNKTPCIYGDIGDIEILERLNLKQAQMVISTVPNKLDNMLVIRKTREVNKKAIIYVTASQVDDALEFYDNGADYVILPHFLGGEHVSILIEDFTGDVNKIIETKLNNIKELKERKELGHEHPEHK